MLKLLSNKHLDEIDRSILEIIQENAGLSNVEIARKINLSPPATHTRIKQLEKEGFIERYVTLLNREKLGYDLLCFIYINLNNHHIEQVEIFENAIKDLPEVLECHHVTGNFDFILKVVIKNTADLKDFIKNKISAIPNIASIQTSLSYEVVKSTTVLPIPIE